MKKILNLIIAIASVILVSCEDSFEPKADFTERYILNSVIHGDSLVQYVSLARSYDVEGFDPYTNNNDPFVKGAQVFIKIRGTSYQMKDTLLARTDTTRYKDPINIYTLSSFVPLANDSIEIIAIPKDGVTLRSKTKIPGKINIYSSKGAITEQLMDISFTWSSRDKDIYFLPRLKVIYTLRSEIPNRLYSTDIPIYIDDKGKKSYPQLTKVSSIFFNGEMIDDAILGIAGDNDKSNYKILRMELEVRLFDEFLTNYISSTNVFYEDISIRLDEPNYTNIEGGLGILGSTLRASRGITVSADYLQSLGYTP